MKLFGFWRSLASFRVRIVLHLKGIAFEEVSIDLLKGEQLGDKYRAVNAQMAVPALDDGAGPPIAESLAIIEYLEERFPKPALLPADPRARARVRSLAQIVACDAHPLIVPRIRNYLAKELKQDEAGIQRWAQHWLNAASTALERKLADDAATGRYCHGDTLSVADVCLVSHAVGSQAYFQCDLTPFPTMMRIVDECLKNEAFARAHPLKQPGAPAKLTH